MRIVERTRVAVTFLTILLVGGLPYALGAQQPAPRQIDLQRYEPRIQEFEAQDKASPPPEGAIVVTGSSSVALWHPTINHDLTPLTIIARGFGGSTMEEALYYIDRIAIAYKPRAIVIYEGDNDIGVYNVAPEKIVGQFEAIVTRVRTALPATRIYAISIKPSVLRQTVWPEAERTNQLLKALCDKNDLLTYVDVATPMLDANGEVKQDIFVDDNLHLNEKGYNLWTAAVRSVLMQGEGKHEPSHLRD